MAVLAGAADELEVGGRNGSVAEVGGAERVVLGCGRAPEMDSERACDGERTCETGREDDDVPGCGGDAGGDGSWSEAGRDMDPEVLVCGWGWLAYEALSGSMSMPEIST